MAIEKAAVIGGGTMGNGIAQVIAQSGIEVTLVDIDAAALTRATDRIKANLERLASREKISSDDVAATLGAAQHLDRPRGGRRRRPTTSIETVIEDFEVKSDVLSRLDKVCREDVVLASNTSQFSITKLAATTGRPDRVIGSPLVQPTAGDEADRDHPRRRDLRRRRWRRPRSWPSATARRRRLPKGHAGVHHLAADRRPGAGGGADRRGGDRRRGRRQPRLRARLQPRDGAARHGRLLRARHDDPGRRQHARPVRRALPGAAGPARPGQRRPPRPQDRPRLQRLLGAAEDGRHRQGRARRRRRRRHDRQPARQRPRRGNPGSARRPPPPRSPPTARSAPSSSPVPAARRSRPAPT